MAATQTWVVNMMSVNVQYEGETDVVYEVTWSCFAEQLDNGQTYTSNYNGSSSFVYQPGQPFTPYDQLTEAQVLQWVWSQPDSNQADIEAWNQANIDQQINPQPISPPLPW